MQPVSTDDAQAAATSRAYVVRRSDRARRSRLTLTEAGGVLVVLPRRAPLDEAARLVAHHGAWIDRHVARVEEERARLAGRPPLGEGRILAVDGVPRRVSTVDGVVARPARGRVETNAGGIIVRPGWDGRDARDLLERWLRDEARRVVGARVQARAAELRVQPRRIAIRDQSSRWASASAKATLSFSWRLILAPPYVLDAVVVHELAHLRVRGHSPAFWSLVAGHAPRTAEARRWLREHAREVRAALD